MKEVELRRRCRCSSCGNKPGKSGMPIFWTVRANRHLVNVDAVKRQSGLEMMMGGHIDLAQVMSPNEDMTHEMNEAEISLCDDCAMKHLPCLFEKGGEE